MENLIAIDSSAYIDNKKPSAALLYTPPGETTPVAAGYIDQAIGMRVNTRADIEGRFVNVDVHYGVYVSSGALPERNLNSPRFNPSEEYSDHPGSVVRDYVGVEVKAPNYPETVTFQEQHAMVIWPGTEYETDVDPGSYPPTPTPTPQGLMAAAGESEPAELATLSESDADAVENSSILDIGRNASLVANGDVVIGDGKTGSPDDAAFDSDVLYVNGVLHLEPRTAPPEFDDSVAPCDRVGVMYFDLTRGCVRVSVAAPREDLQRKDWKEAEVAWVDVKLNKKTFDPKTDVKSPKGQAAKMPNAKLDEIWASVEREKANASAGNSVFGKSRPDLARMK